MSSFPRVAFATLFLILGSSLQAGDSCVDMGWFQSPKWRVLIENDVLALDSWTELNDDRNYTMGVIVSTYGASAESGLMARALHGIDRMWFPRSNGEYLCSYSQNDYGVSAFTPNELEEAAPIPGDRPYASLMMGSNFRTRVFSDRAVRTRLVVGVLGLDVAKAVQRFLHNDLHISNQDPLGWDNQISEGGEPTAMYGYETIRPFSGDDAKPVTNGGIDIAYKYGLNLGYYTNVYGGAALRFGRILTPYHAWEPNLSSAINQNLFAFDGSRAPGELYGFIGYTARVVGYNVLLQGQFRDSTVKFESSDIERLVHEASAGVTYTLPSGSKLTYALQYRSPEFEGPFRREHWYGGITFAKSFGGAGRSN